MKTPTWITVAAFPVLLVLAAVTEAGDPDAILRSTLGDENQSRQESERRARELSRQQEQALKQLQQMNRGSTGTQIYNALGCPNINDLSDPSCEEQRRRINEERGGSRQVPPAPPTPREQQRPADLDCGPAGLFGAPAECHETRTMTVGQGPCRRVITYAKGYENTAHGSGNLTRAQLTRCERFIEAQQNQQCHPDPKDGQYMYYKRDACRYRVEKEITGGRGLH